MADERAHWVKMHHQNYGHDPDPECLDDFLLLSEPAGPHPLARHRCTKCAEIDTAREREYWAKMHRGMYGHDPSDGYLDDYLASIVPGGLHPRDCRPCPKCEEIYAAVAAARAKVNDPSAP